MVDIHCVCGRTIPVPADTKERLIRCPSCDASHDLKPTSVRQRILLVALILVTLFAVGWLVKGLSKNNAGPGDQGPPPVDQFEEARQLFDQGDLRGAEGRLKRLLAVDPKAVNGHFLLGRIYQRQGNYELAEPHFRQAHEGKPDDPEGSRSLAEAWIMLGRAEDAVDLLEPLQKRNPDVRTAMVLGDAYFAIDRYDVASEVFAWAWKAEPESLRAALCLLRSLLHLGKMSEAEEVAKKAPDGLPPDDRAYGKILLESSLLREKGDLEGALALLDPEKAPKYSTDLERTRTQYLFELGRFDEMFGVATDLQKKMRHPVVYVDVMYLKIIGLLLQRKLKEAKEEAGKAVFDMQLHSHVTELKDKLEAILIVEGRSNRDRLLKRMDALPKRAHNDHYLFLAALSRAEGREAEYRRDLETARKSTLGKNFPHFLIESLLKKE